MLAATGFQTCYCRLGSADALGNFGLRYACGSSCFQEFVEKGKFLVKLVIFCFYVRSFKSAGLKFFVGEHL